MDYLAKFEFGNYYHVFNKTNNTELLFRNDKNRYYFINRYQHFLEDYIDTYAFCLLPNHFHFLLQVKGKDKILGHLTRQPQSKLTKTQSRFLNAELPDEYTHSLLEMQFSRLFTSYAMTFNKMWDRSGNLFYRPFKRKVIADEFHLMGNILYIHHNPIHHHYCTTYEDYRWSSYNSYFSPLDSTLKRNAVLDWFGGRKEFVKWHHDYQDFRNSPLFIA